MAGMLDSGQLFLCMLLQVLGPVLILIALAVEVVAFSMHLCHVHNLSKSRLCFSMIHQHRVLIAISQMGSSHPFFGGILVFWSFLEKK